MKGKSGTGRSLVAETKARLSPTGNALVHLFILGVDELKTLVYEHLQIMDPNTPGYCFFPRNDLTYNEEHFKALTCEVPKISYRNGVPYKEWIRPGGRANEPLDCRVYALAGLFILNPVWEGLKSRDEKRAKLKNFSGDELKTEINDVVPKANRIKKARPSKFVNSWKD